jgi:hypothetical protein
MADPPTLHGTGSWRQRPTIDLVVLILTCLVALVMLVAVVAIAAVVLTNSQADAGAAASVISDQVSLILGALLGLIAGRATGARQAPF